MSCLFEPFEMLFAVRIILNAESRPVIERIAQALVASISHADLSAFAALPRNGCYTTVCPQCVIVAFSQWTGAFGYDHAGEYATDAWQRKQEGYVTVLR